MIFDSVKNIETYRGISARFDAAIDAVVSTDFASLQDGRHELDGSALYFNLSTITTLEDNKTPESHVRYIDIQLPLSDSEVMGVAPLEEMKDAVKSSEADDYTLWNGETQKIRVKPGQFVVFFPNDAHAPCIADGTCGKLRKVVFKVML